MAKTRQGRKIRGKLSYKPTKKEAKRAAKFKSIKHINYHPCNVCDGKDKTCKSCRGTGAAKDYNYSLIYKNLGFSCDTLK